MIWLWVKTNGTLREDQNRWCIGVHPPQNGGVGYDPWPYEQTHTYLISYKRTRLTGGWHIFMSRKLCWQFCRADVAQEIDSQPGPSFKIGCRRKAWENAALGSVGQGLDTHMLPVVKWRKGQDMCK